MARYNPSFNVPAWVGVLVLPFYAFVIIGYFIYAMVWLVIHFFIWAVRLLGWGATLILRAFRLA